MSNARVISIIFSKGVGLALTALVLAMGARAGAVEMKYSFEKDSRVLQLFDFDDKQVIVFNGDMSPGQSRESYRGLLSKLMPGKDIVVLFGASGGGAEDRFVEFSETLRRTCPKEDCKITTYVHKVCGSACVWLYMVGDERLSSSEASFVFHRAAIGGLGFDVIVQTRQDLEDKFVSWGADREWMHENIERLTANQRAGVYASPPQMLHAKIVQRIDDEYLAKTLSVLPVEFSLTYGKPAGGTYLDEAPAPTGWTR